LVSKRGIFISTWWDPFPTRLTSSTKLLHQFVLPPFIHQ
jgi:hypothetical protein